MGMKAEIGMKAEMGMRMRKSGECPLCEQEKLRSHAPSGLIYSMFYDDNSPLPVIHPSMSPKPFIVNMIHTLVESVCRLFRIGFSKECLGLAKKIPPRGDGV